jgi:hypothetical protein
MGVSIRPLSELLGRMMQVKFGLRDGSGPPGHEARGRQACGGRRVTPYESELNNRRLFCVEAEAVLRRG